MKRSKLGELIYRTRCEKELSQITVEKLSKHEITCVSVCNIENGKQKNPKPQTLRVLAKVLNLDYLHLMQLAGHITDKDLRGF